MSPKFERMKSKKTEIQLKIIHKLRYLRQYYNLSQVQICDILGLNSAGQIGNIESPKFKQKYTIQQIYKLANFFNYPVEKIFLTDKELEKSTTEVVNDLILRLIDYEKQLN